MSDVAATRRLEEQWQVAREHGRFHSYSLGNQLLALFQCFGRGIQPGPLATFPNHKESLLLKGRLQPAQRLGLALCRHPGL
jgi:hypothetical protein